METVIRSRDGERERKMEKRTSEKEGLIRRERRIYFGSEREREEKRR